MNDETIEGIRRGPRQAIVAKTAIALRDAIAILGVKDATECALVLYKAGLLAEPGKGDLTVQVSRQDRPGSTGPHLHAEFSRGGVPMDAERWRTSSQAFRSTTAQNDADEAEPLIDPTEGELPTEETL